MFILLLSLLLQQSTSLKITKCCQDVVTSIDLATLTCYPATTNTPAFQDNSPKIFSLQAESYVNHPLEVSRTGIPQCQPGQVLTSISLVGDNDEKFVLLAEDQSLFVTKDSSTHSDYCVDESQSAGVRVGSTALFCIPDPELVCSSKLCIPTCCPQEMVLDESVGHCIYKQGYTLEPTFVDRAYNPVSIINKDDYVLIEGEPECNTHTYQGGEFNLMDDGLLHIGHHVFNYSQYCLEEEDHGNMRAKVCDQTSSDQREILSLISTNITPALLIISEVFLLLTFVLHVIVPDFRKQMFGWMKMCTVASLFLGYKMLIIVILGSSVLLEDYPVICQILGFLIQYFFLSAFCWMSAMSGEVWSTFRQLAHSDMRHRNQRIRFYYFNIYSWGLPGLVTIVTFAMHVLPQELAESIVTPGFGNDTCFFHGYAAQMVYFHGIIAALLVINLLFFMASSYALLFGIWAPARDTDSGGRSNTRQMFWIVVELFLVMGLTWLADVVSLVINYVYGKAYAGWEIIIFDIVNSLQGLLIFLVLVCKPRMRRTIKASLAPALKCFNHKKFDTTDGQGREIGMSTVSPKTKTSMVFGSCSPESKATSVTHIKDLTQHLTSKASLQSTILDSLTPAWKRGSYNLAFYHSQDDPAGVNITALTQTESKC